MGPCVALARLSDMALISHVPAGWKILRRCPGEEMANELSVTKIGSVPITGTNCFPSQAY
jgi:hypothetical protein